MYSSVRVSVPGHVHIGNFDLTGDLGRVFGTLGIALERPRLVVELQRAPPGTGIVVDSPDVTYRERALYYAELSLRALEIQEADVKIRICDIIPVHVGLGSQTALALSIGVGLAKLYGIDVDVLDLAVKLRRGTVSGLGLYSFLYGGFIVDGGVRHVGAGPPPLIFRCDFPQNWYIVVAVPSKPIAKILEIKQREDDILASLEPMPSELSARLSRLVLVKIIPSIIERDIDEFGQGITMFNKTAGEYWKDKQGGLTYCDPIVEEGVNLMLRLGCRGACQSCWGPTFYGIVEGESAAERVAKEISKFLSERGGGLVLYTRADNRGAVIEGV